MLRNDRLIPVAQYLRMSTEDQQYSIVNQRDQIQKYAREHGFDIVKTYEDPGKSGVVLKYRRGLSALLQDVVGREATFKAILVYDVSRWGRFQNPDEAAHYEFLCANAGIPLHYCAEQFSNDGTASSSIFKALKRSMAAEFSRELGEKVFRGKARLAGMGFWMGGPAGYGYRRRVVSEQGKLGRFLKPGEQKGLRTDRITLALGPRKEVEGVQLIFAMAARGANCTDIVRALNRKHLLIHGREWNDVTVLEILSNPKYTGANVWHRRTIRLHTRLRRVEPQDWIGKPQVFPPIVDQQTFDRAQATIKRMRDSHWSAQKVVRKVQAFLKTKGRLTEELIVTTSGMPCSGTIRRYFGSYTHLYAALKFTPDPFHAERAAQARRSAKLRKELGEKLKKLFPDHVDLFFSKRGARSVLRIDDAFMVSILFCRQEEPRRKPPKQRTGKRPGPDIIPGPFWLATSAPEERAHITLLCLASKTFDRISDFYVAERMGSQDYMRLRRNCQFLRKAIRLRSLEGFYSAVTRVWTLKKESLEAHG